MTHPKFFGDCDAPFQDNETFIWRGQTYKVRHCGRDMNGKWIVIAWRFIKTKQDYSRNAYHYSADSILDDLVEKVS